MQYTLQQHLRFLIHRKIRPLFIKDSCEVCGTRDDLEMHHTKPFSKMLDEALDFLELPHRKHGEYSKREIALIEHVVLSEHLSVMMVTLCEECHHIEHRSGGVNHMFYYNQKKEREREAHVQEVFIPYIESLKNKRLYLKEDRDKISKVANLKRNGRLVKSIGKLNEFLEEIGVEYTIHSKRGVYYDTKTKTQKQKRYWIILPNNTERGRLHFRELSKDRSKHFP